MIENMLKITKEKYRKSYTTEAAFLTDYFTMATSYLARRVESSLPSFFCIEYTKKAQDRVYRLEVE